MHSPITESSIARYKYGRMRLVATREPTLRHLLIALLVAATASAQNPATQGFDAASIKRNVSGSDFAEGGFQPGGRIAAVNVTLRNLVIAAYGMPSDRIEGGPDWVNTARFDVVAVGNQNSSVGETREMLRLLLADRFRLTTRTETRERPTFALVPTRSDGRPGPELRATSAECKAKRVSPEDQPPPTAPPDPDDLSCGSIGFRGGLLAGRAVSMTQLANSLSGFAGREVIDRTGLDGFYDFTLRFSSRAVSTERTDPPEIFTALREQLGLRLNAEQGPVRVLVMVTAIQPNLD